MIPPLKRKCKIIPFFILFKYLREKDEVFSGNTKNGLCAASKLISRLFTELLISVKSTCVDSSCDSKYLPIFA